MATTHIRVSERTWKMLNRLKSPGDDFNDVCHRLAVNTFDDPGIYLVNSTGESYALATESGDGDRELLREALEEHDVEVLERHGENDE